MLVDNEQLSRPLRKGVGDTLDNPVFHTGVCGVLLTSGIIPFYDKIFGIIPLYQEVVLPRVGGDFPNNRRRKELLKEHRVGLGGYDPGAVKADYVLVVR